jgi:flagellar assembly protein FliH
MEEASAVAADNKTIGEKKTSLQAVSEQQTTVDIEAIKDEFYALGKKEAEQEASRGLQQAASTFTCACTEINALHKNLLEQSRGDTINLVMALTKKILARELQTDREAIVRTLQEAIEISLDSSEYDIWLNPKDLDTALKMTEGLSEKTNGLKQIRLKTDPDISRGGCRLESTICRVDATIEAQMESSREFLEEHYRETESKGNKNKPEKTEHRV